MDLWVLHISLYIYIYRSKLNFYTSFLNLTGRLVQENIKYLIFNKYFYINIIDNNNIVGDGRLGIDPKKRVNWIC